MSYVNRYSHHARRALLHAGMLVKQYHHPRVDTGHLLVGVLQTRGSIGYTVLDELGLDAKRAQPQLQELTVALSQPPEDVQNDAALDMALDLAADESAWLGHHYIGTEHFLLGMTRTNLGNASDLLHRLNVTPEQVRRRVRRALSAGMYEFSQETLRHSARFSELSRRVIIAAESLSVRLDHPSVGIGHLLWAMASEQRGATTTLLHDHAMDKERLHRVLTGERGSEHLPGLLTSIEHILDPASELAERFGNHYTGTEHLLLAMLSDEALQTTLQHYVEEITQLRDALRDRMTTR